MKHSTDRFILAATDLSNHLSCHHLTQLNRQVAQNIISKPSWHDPMMDVLRDRGMEHEQAYVDHLRAFGKKVVNLRGKSQEDVIKAMVEGADVLVQVRLQSGAWQGIADILIKVEGSSRFGNWAYEVQDTKLTQNTKAGTILQLCLYSELLAEIQGADPENLSVIIPGNDFKPEQYRYADFSAYYRQVKKQFEQIMSGPDQPTYPEPVAQCQICNWWQECNDKRHKDDYLSLVAGIQSMQIEELKLQQINRLEQFAQTEDLRNPNRGSLDALKRRQDQARIQLEGRLQKKLIFKSLEMVAERGLHRLPEPNEGDIYLDLEGDNFFDGGGLEYLLGYATNKEKISGYHKIWSTNKQVEKKAFCEFMAFVKSNWEQYPSMHIYHFAPYEPAAIKRLAMVHSVYEAEVDKLARGERFIDLHQVFKESFLASVETYSLKELEKFADFKRQLELPQASSARKKVEVALELNVFNHLPEQVILELEAYNEDDCRATEALHNWLEQQRKEELTKGIQIDRPLPRDTEPKEELKELDARSKQLFDLLSKNLPEDKVAWNKEHKARWLLANLLAYFRREDKSAWWEYFRVHKLDHDDLLDERKAITGLEFLEELPKSGRDRNPTHRYRFPPQEIRIEPEDKLEEVLGKSVGSVQAISLENNTVDIKKATKAIDIHPLAVHVPERIDPKLLAASLADVALNIEAAGFSEHSNYPASLHLLMKSSPKLVNGYEGPLYQTGESTVEGAIRILSLLDSGTLAIQGPPGTGKTYTGARMIIDLFRKGKKIGITAISHKVIRTLARAVLQQKPDGLEILFEHKGSAGDPDNIPAIREEDNSDKVRTAIQDGKIGCGTAYFWSEDASKGILDYLFIDEAGQMSLAHALAASRAAKNLILLGDPQQLEQPQKGSHPEGSDVTALTHLLDGNKTMPEEKGLFLGTTRRLNPAICQFTSELFYNSHLKSKGGLENQVISGTTLFDGAGLFYVPVSHMGNQNRANEEVAVIERIVGSLLDNGQWSNEQGRVQPIENNDILIVAPFNAQVGALRQRLPGLNIGTVDRFQGQEAPVVIYSMTSSSAEDAPRGMNFLYNLNRLNVATSRAKCICILVASPLLFEPECHTIEQMKLANALCRYKEMARVVEV